MNKYVIMGLLMCMIVQKNAHAQCTETTVYTACKPGYYLTNGDCVACPIENNIAGTTVDKNTGNKTSCHIPSGTSATDITGTFTYAGDSYWCE